MINAVPYVGDFSVGDTVRWYWGSAASTGASVNRAVDGTVQVYKDGGLTQTTVGVTDTEGFDSLAGVHATAVNLAADGTIYSAGSDFVAVLAGATIDGVTVNVPLFGFSIENRIALADVQTIDGAPVTATDTVDANVLTIVTAAVDSIWAKAMTEISAPPAVTASLLDALRWIFAMTRNKITQTSSAQALRNDADSGNIGTAPVSDDGTTWTRGEWVP